MRTPAFVMSSVWASSEEVEFSSANSRTGSTALTRSRRRLLSKNDSLRVQRPTAAEDFLLTAGSIVA